MSIRIQTYFYKGEIIKSEKLIYILTKLSLQANLKKNYFQIYGINLLENTDFQNPDENCAFDQYNSLLHHVKKINTSSAA